MIVQPTVFTVDLDHGARVARLSKGAWSQVVGFDALPDQLRFYRGLRDRGVSAPHPRDMGKVVAKDGPFAPHYQDTVAALEQALKEVGRG